MEQTPNNSNSLLKMGLILIVALLIGSFVLKWLLALAIPILLFLHKDLVFKIGAKLMALYHKNSLIGILAMIGSFLMLSPFSIFLFGRSIYQLFASGKIQIPDQESIKDALGKSPQKENYTPSTEGLMTLEEIKAKLNEE